MQVFLQIIVEFYACLNKTTFFLKIKQFFVCLNFLLALRSSSVTIYIITFFLLKFLCGIIYIAYAMNYLYIICFRNLK